MGFWDSVRTAVDRVTGSAANVTLSIDPQRVKPGQTVSVGISIKNGIGALEARGLLMEIESVEEINLPRSADLANLVVDAAAAASASRTPGRRHVAAQDACHSETMFKAKVVVAPGMTLAPGQERNFKGSFKLPLDVQPSYEGKYANHIWRLRARLDVLGVDPGSGWIVFHVSTAA